MARRNASHSVGDTARALRVAGSLDPATLSGIEPGGYSVTLYPQSGEGSVCRVTVGNRNPNAKPRGTYEERRRRCLENAAKRARGSVRRYCRALRLRFLWTLTTADVVDFRVISERWDRFYDRLRHRKPRMPMVAVFEPHPGGHGWHVHFALDRFVSIELIRQLWGHGHVWVGDPKKLPGRVPPRKLAAYLAKYVTKTMDGEGEAPVGDGRHEYAHRYRCARGFEPAIVKFTVATPHDGHHWLAVLYGAPDAIYGFSLADTGDEDAWWLQYPDKLLWPAPRWRPPELPTSR